jgi:23S rRNA (adenine2503-C2)-methyltransferase
VIEYVLLKDVNDTDADAQRLLELLSEVYCMINLIVFNPHEGTAFQKTDEAQVIAGFCTQRQDTSKLARFCGRG